MLLKSYIFLLKFLNQLSEHTIYKRLANIIFLLLVFSTLLVDPVGVRLKTAMVEYSATVSAAGVRVRIRWVCVYQQAGKEIGHNCNNMRRWMELTNIFPIYWFGESQVVMKDKIFHPKRNQDSIFKVWQEIESIRVCTLQVQMRGSQSSRGRAESNLWTWWVVNQLTLSWQANRQSDKKSISGSPSSSSRQSEGEICWNSILGLSFFCFVTAHCKLTL